MKRVLICISKIHDLVFLVDKLLIAGYGIIHKRVIPYFFA